MILNSTADIKKHVSVAESLQFADFQPYIQKAVNTFTKKYVGNLHTTLADAATGTNADVKNQARDYLQAAIANFGWFIYLPMASVQMDSSGISVAQTEYRKSADFWQIKDIRREALRAGHEAMDLLLEVLEANPTVFTDYADNYSTVNNELLVNNASVFNKWYHINNSRQVYLALQPTLRHVEKQYLNTFICADLIQALKVIPDNATSEQKEALTTLKDTLQSVMVNFAVSKVAATGLFQLTQDGLRLNFESYLGGRSQSVDSGLSASQVNTLLTQLADNATVYLQQAKDFIKNNITLFNQCDNPLLTTENTTSYSTYNTKGVFGL